jgi:nucleoside-diphosphate-sugar epimerase
MRALVTGATGFVGGHLVEALSRRGDRVTALVRTPGKARLLEQLGVHQVAGDLHDPEALARACAGQDVVYHVAGVVAAPSEPAFLRANRDGTFGLTAAMARTAPAARLVLVSSMAAGGPSTPGHPLAGDEPPRPVTQYGRSKLAGEGVVRESALAWTIVRPPMVYGPRDTEVLKVFKLVGWGLAPVFGDGRQELSAVFGPDLAEALIAAAVSSRTVGRVYYPCHPAWFTSAGLVEGVGRALAKRPRLLHLPAGLGRAVLSLTGGLAALTGRATILTADKAAEFLQPAWTADPGPLTRDAGWSAAHDLDAGLAITTAWYREQGWI